MRSSWSASSSMMSSFSFATSCDLSRAPLPGAHRVVVRLSGVVSDVRYVPGGVKSPTTGAIAHLSQTLPAALFLREVVVRVLVDLHPVIRAREDRLQELLGVRGLDRVAVRPVARRLLHLLAVADA